MTPICLFVCVYNCITITQSNKRWPVQQEMTPTESDDPYNKRWHLQQDMTPTTIDTRHGHTTGTRVRLRDRRHVYTTGAKVRLRDRRHGHTTGTKVRLRDRPNGYTTGTKVRLRDRLHRHTTGTKVRLRDRRAIQLVTVCSETTPHGSSKTFSEWISVYIYEPIDKLIVP